MCIRDRHTTVVPHTIRTNLYDMLEAEKEKNESVIPLPNSKVETKRVRIGTFFKVAASIALLIGSFLLGKYQGDQSATTLLAQAADENLAITQTAMLSLMENKSASKRIQGVGYIEVFEMPDEAIVKALADRVLFDENTNCLLYTSPSPRDLSTSRMPSSA